MASVGARIIMFVSSYLPLEAIFVVQYWGKEGAIAYTSLALCIVGPLALAGVLWSSSRDKEPVKEHVVESRLRGDEVMGYIAGYLLPFLATDLTDMRQLLSAAVFLAVLGYLYVTTDMLYINPTLNFICYRVYEVTFESQQVHPVISRKRPRQGDVVEVVRLTSRIWIVKAGR